MCVRLVLHRPWPIFSVGFTHLSLLRLSLHEQHSKSHFVCGFFFDENDEEAEWPPMRHRFQSILMLLLVVVGGGSVGNPFVKLCRKHNRQYEQTNRMACGSACGCPKWSTFPVMHRFGKLLANRNQHQRSAMTDRTSSVCEEC